MELKIFKNELFGEIRTVSNNGTPLFSAYDVAKSLGYSNPAEAISTHCKSGNIEKRYVEHANGIGGVNIQFIPESELYRLIMKSKLPNAESFQDWVVEDILPTIRKHGAYLTNETIEQALLSPDTIIRIATELKREREARELAQKTVELQSNQLKESAPKVEYYETVLQSNSTYTTTLIAKELGMGAPTLNEKLKSMGVQYKQNGQWVLSYTYQNKGYTKTKTYSFTRKDGSTGTQSETVWTEKGREFIHNKFRVN